MLLRSIVQEGSVSFFAELSEVTARQAERIEEKRAEHRAEAKAEKKEEAEAIAKKFEAAKPPKKGFIKAGSIREFIDSIKGLDDEALEKLMNAPKDRVDLSV